MSDQIDKNILDKPAKQETPQSKQEETEEINKLAQLWDRVRQLGITEPVIRYGTHILTLGVIVIVVFVLGNLLINNTKPKAAQAPVENQESGNTSAERDTSPETISEGVILPEYSQPSSVYYAGIPRKAEPKTIIPSRPRVDVIIYVVEPGDNLFMIAEQYGLQAETILWGNFDTLQDNPRFIVPGQELNILPIDGIYYRYNVGETLNMIAENFETTSDAILAYPGNHLDPYETNPDDPGISDGTMLIIPGGTRELVEWGPPPISRDNPAAAQYYGPGYCGEIYEGNVGDGIFVWPTVATYLSGYPYDPVTHPAIDIGGAEGNAIFATDSGVIVYAGWSNYGYGNLVVIDHGNGWQSAYAHLLSYNVGCGDNVFRGDVIGALGNTGNSSGAHLHFEIISPWGKINPFDVVGP